jgi:acylphosphatase
VEEFARQLKLTGFVENVKPYDVRIVVEGEDEAIKQFIEKVQIRKPPIIVERVEAQFESATGEFEYFAIKRGEMADELGERLDIANARMTGMIEKQDVMIEKLDAGTALLKENTDTLKGFRSESNANFELLHQDNRALKELMAQHALTTEERIDALATEISAVKERLERLEAVRAS